MRNLTNRAQTFIIRWIVNAVALIIVVHLVPGITISSPVSLFTAALVLGLLNAVIKPFLVLLTLPLTVLSLGLFTLIINGFLFFATAKLVQGFLVLNFWDAFWAAILFSFFSFLLNHLLLPKDHITVTRIKRSNPGINRTVIDTEGVIVDEPEDKNK